MVVFDEREPSVSLWVAALRLLIEDAMRAAHRGHRASHQDIEALNDILVAGPITRRLCKPIGIDPDTVRAAVRSKLDLPRAHRGHSVSSRSIA